MKNHATAVEAATAILRTSCASDGCGSVSTLASLAESIVKAIADTEAGATVEGAVLAHWEMDDVERRAVFGT